MRNKGLLTFLLLFSLVFIPTPRVQAFTVSTSTPISSPALPSIPCPKYTPFVCASDVRKMITAAISPIQSLLQTIQNDISSLQNSQSQDNQRLTNLENTVANQSSQINNLNDEVSNLQASLSAITNTIPKVVFQDNFDSGNYNNWDIINGGWQVVNGVFEALTPNGNFPNMALIKNLDIGDYTFDMDMISIQNVDKYVFVRYQDQNNYTALNFRAERPQTPSDVVIEETFNGVVTRYTPEFSVPISNHTVGQPIHVRVQEKGDTMTVFVNYIQVLSATYPFHYSHGRLGVGTIAGEQAGFDNIVVSTNP